MTSIGIISSVMVWFDVASMLDSCVDDEEEEEVVVVERGSEEEEEEVGGIRVSWSHGRGNLVTRGFSASMLRTTLFRSTSPSGGFCD